jgi:hypothetical protein
MAKKLEHIVDVPNEHEIISIHNRFMKELKLHQAKKEYLAAIDFLKIAYSDPGKIGVRAIDIRYLLNPSERKKLETINIRLLLMFIDYWKIPGENFDVALKKLDHLRFKKMISIVKHIDNAILSHGFFPNCRLFRFMNEPFHHNVLHSFTSWSLYPLHEFCSNGKLCHLYIIEKFEEKINGLYVEMPGQELDQWEYEFLLPRGITYKTVRSAEYKILDPNFRKRWGAKKRSGKVTVVVHYIHITGIKKIPISSIKKFETKKVTL